VTERPTVRRCAIYTRKSSDEGLDQAYNSLDAQRDACRAYITSQTHEGWVPVDRSYNDGGFSGGSLQRPALQALMEDMAKGLVDIIVVYKIDRLTRSLADFAKLTEVLDRHQVSFVAVTQQFNTSTSMGRLTLNVLLSFAQFEREVAGERIRDKIAASKKRGMWMGGHPPLGYEVRDRKLIVNAEEADTVRHIYNRYLELKSVRLLMSDLEQSGICSKRHVWKDGTTHGGSTIARGALYTILKNPIYRGLISHKGQTHPGEHSAIIPDALFASVQRTLTDQGPGEEARSKRASPSLLKGLAFDTAGHRLQPTHANKKGSRYRYYVSSRMIRNVKAAPDGLRVPAADLERIVIYAIAGKLRNGTWVSAVLAGLTDASGISIAIASAGLLAARVEHQVVQNTGVIATTISRITVSKSTIKVQLDRAALVKILLTGSTSGDPAISEKEMIDIVIDGQFLRCGKQVRLVLGNTADDRLKQNAQLVTEILRARRWYGDLASGQAASIAELARRDRCSASYISLKISLALLAPDLLQSILEGTQHPSLTPERLKKACPLPVSWDEQRAILLG
jgi:site-specific DNA recombinase